MATITSGLFIVKKQRPDVKPAGDGEPFRLRLFVFDRQARLCEDYSVLWCGDEAAQFWREHGADLRPGTPLRLELENPHSYSLGHYLGTETHASVRKCELAPRPHEVHATATRAA